MDLSNLVKIKENMYVSKNQTKWYKKALKHCNNNPKALLELAKEYENKNEYLKAYNIYSNLSNNGNLLAKERYEKLKSNLELKYKKDKLNKIETKKKKRNKIIKNSLLLALIILLLLLLPSFLNNFLINAKNIIKETNIFKITKKENIKNEKNIFFYPEKISKNNLEGNFIKRDIFIDENLSLENIILKAEKEIENVSKNYSRNEKIIIYLKDKVTKKTLYEVLWTPKEKNKYKIYKEAKGSYPLAFNNKSIYVDSKNNNIYILKKNRIIKSIKASMGKKDTPTPKGLFKIQKKVKLNPKTSGVYGACWIGLSKPHYGIHGTDNEKSIGTNETKGCIRLNNDEILYLYNFLNEGDFVLID
ncbi:MAG: L,D-transpeptidase [Firmicutes bacterium]|nr:L,D-transpeptidase [Bacillota bacterium]